MQNANPLEMLAAEYSDFEASHGLDQDSPEDRLHRRLPPGVQRWLSDYEFRRDAAVVLAPLADKALSAEYGTQEHEDAHNAFADAIEPYMTNDQRREWDDWCLKASDEEQIDQAFRILGIPSPIVRE